MTARDYIDQALFESWSSHAEAFAKPLSKSRESVWLRWGVIRKAWFYAERQGLRFSIAEFARETGLHAETITYALSPNFREAKRDVIKERARRRRAKPIDSDLTNALRRFRKVWELWESVDWDEKRRGEIARELDRIEAAQETRRAA